MSEQHGLRALNTHFLRGLFQFTATACAMALSPSLALLAQGPALPAGLFAVLVLLTAFWLRACWKALEPLLSLTSLSLELAAYRRFFPALVAWGLAPLVLQGVRRGLESLGRGLPHAVALGVMLLTSAAMVLCALAVLIINRYVWHYTRGQVARARALLDSYTRAGHAQELKRLTAWIEWKEGRGGPWPDLLVRESYFPGIRLQPWHEAAEFEAVRELERHADEIRAEVMALASDQSVLGREAAANPEMRQWHSAYLWRRYSPVPHMRARCPKTVMLLDRLIQGACRDAMISVLGPGGRIALHQDPDNLFLTCHLGIVIPEGCGLHLAGETRTWQEGRCMVFNAAFEHYAWNDSRTPRVVLLADFLHPDFTPLERRFLTEYLTGGGEPAPAQPMPQANLTAS